MDRVVVRAVVRLGEVLAALAAWSGVTVAVGVAVLVGARVAEGVRARS
jgi:hypothetical protein